MIITPNKNFTDPKEEIRAFKKILMTVLTIDTMNRIYKQEGMEGLKRWMKSKPGSRKRKRRRHRQKSSITTTKASAGKSAAKPS